MEIYVNELCNYFDKVLIVTNKRDILQPDFLPNIEILQVTNEGYDFGMFYKGYQHISGQKYTQIACINDSNILFGSLKPVFDWANIQNCDFWGLADSENKPSYSTHPNNYHLQSHFLVFNQLCISYLDEYLNTLNINRIFETKKQKQVKKLVIDKWEIGLSQFFIGKGAKVGAYFSVKNLGEFSKAEKNMDKLNITLDLYADIISAGIPIIKKKIITSIKPKYLFSKNENWQYLIKKNIAKSIDFKRLKKELISIRNLHLKMRLFNYFS